MGTRFVEIPLGDTAKLEEAYDAGVLVRKDCWGYTTGVPNPPFPVRPIPGVSTDWKAWAGYGTNFHSRFGVLVEED